MRVSAFYVDQQQPLIVALYGEATPVIMAMAGFVAPYVVARQGTRPLEVEVFGMMDMILEELEATDLPRDEYRRLRDSGAVRAAPAARQRRAADAAHAAHARQIFDDMAAQRSPRRCDCARHCRSRSATRRRRRPSICRSRRRAAAAICRSICQPPPVAPPAAQPPKRTFDPDAVPIFFNPRSRFSAWDECPPPVPPLPPRES